MDERDVRETVYRLVEADSDQEDARARLERFKESDTPPPAPTGFDGLDAFLDFYRSTREYEDTLRSLEDEIEAAEEAYKSAEKTLQNILPENAPLTFIYGGRRPDLEGVAYRIVNRRMGTRTQIVIMPARPSEE